MHACIYIYRVQIKIVQLHRCDRILWFGKGIKQLVYRRAEIALSDHRPVTATFVVEVEIFDQRKLKKALNFSSAVVHPEIFVDQAQEYQLFQHVDR